MVYLISIDYNHLLSVDLAFCESYTCITIVFTRRYNRFADFRNGQGDITYIFGNPHWLFPFVSSFLKKDRT